MLKRVFLDSDVIISSLISSVGASSLLIKESKSTFFISNFSKKELELVIKRMNLDKKKLSYLVTNRVKTVRLKEKTKDIKTIYQDFVKDINDAHIIAGAVKAKVKFLITYNKRHFKKEEIKRKFNIFILTPGEYLQYQRSIS